MAADVRAENQCMNKLGREGGLRHSLTVCPWTDTSCRDGCSPGGYSPPAQIWKSTNNSSFQKSGAVEVAHMYSCIWLSMKYVGIKRIYGQKWELPGAEKHKHCLLSKTTTQDDCSESTLTRPLANGGTHERDFPLGFIHAIMPFVGMLGRNKIVALFRVNTQIFFSTPVIFGYTEQNIDTSPLPPWTFFCQWLGTM